MTSIEWTDATWNPVAGCTPVSPGCLNCYAATMAPRLAAMGQKQYVGLTVRKGENDLEAGGGPGRDVFNGTIRLLEDRLTAPLRWRTPRMVFVNSMSDLFHEDVPFEFIDKVFAVMALCPRHTFQVLTKRPERMAGYFARPWSEIGWDDKAESHHGYEGSNIYWDKFHREHGPPPWPGDANPWPLPNVWLGTSVEDQARADERIPHLLRCPAEVRFLSCEPLLGAVDLTGQFLLQRAAGVRRVAAGQMPWDAPKVKHPSIDWVIVGGESGPHARPCDVAWIRSIRDQCRAAGVPVFVKQLGADPCNLPMHLGDGSGRGGLRDRKGGDPAEWPEDLRVRDWPVSSQLKGLGCSC